VENPFAADTIGAFLALSEGLIEEYDILPDDGIFGWQTRHPVIDTTIARYKYADQEELFNLLSIESLNPTVCVELGTIRDLCSDQGIRRITNEHRRIQLYQALIAVAPGERIPRHRLISELLRIDDTNGAESAIRAAEQDVGMDSPRVVQRSPRASTRVHYRGHNG
jgi:hypothetical protein